jgi:hypothetical protein
MRVSGLTITPQGRRFHNGTKTAFLTVVDGGVPFEKLSELDIDPLWLQDHGENFPPNWDFLFNMKVKYFEKYDKIAAASGIAGFVTAKLFRAAVERLWDMGLCTYRQDETYLERIGYAVNVLLDHEQDYREKKDMLDILFEEFFKVEKRQDRIDRYRDIANWLKKLRDSNKFFQISYVWILEYIYTHRYEWSDLVLDVKGFNMYDPKFWGGNPGGRSDIWMLINNGQG